VSAAAIILAAVAAGCLPASCALAVARWPRRSPAAAIVLWQALGLGWGLAAVGALAGLGTAGGGRSGVAAGAVKQASRLLRAGRDQDVGTWSLLTVLRIACLASGIVLLLLLCWILVAAFAAVFRSRQRQRALLGLLAHGDPKVPGALVVDHPAAAAYCVPGLRSAIVISAGALDLLDQAELAAVLAHERAHLRERHDLVLLPFTALLRAFRWSRIARQAHAAVALLVEMHADDCARRHRPARELATALLRVGAAGGGRAPAGTLAASEAGTSGEVTARVMRLLRPAPGLCAAALALVCAAAVVVVAIPAAFLTLPI
jgi:beta-lactamase regulating signal transducer with metallopeptidase domain